MYSHIPEYDLKAVNNRFAEKTYTPGNGIQIVVGSGSKIAARVKSAFQSLNKPSSVSYFMVRPERVTYVDIVKK